MKHHPVLLAQAIEGLAIKPEGIYVDGTFGRGGHSQAILSALSAKGKLLAMDRDPEAVAWAKAHINDPRFEIVHANYADMEKVVEQHGCLGKVNGILLDIGVSSPQLDTAKRGFSFLQEGVLDMRMDPSTGMDAATWLASASEADIAEILRTFGGERFARRIASRIVQERQSHPITTTTQLADTVKRAQPVWDKHKHPATRTFQALRIFINDELGCLQRGLQASVSVLAKHGRLVVISFHSLEDREVKRFLRGKNANKPKVPTYIPLQEEYACRIMRPIGKAVLPDEQEIKRNPRARSATLRIGEKML